MISGHWDTREPAVNVVDLNDTIYDFYGFPDAMYKVVPRPTYQNFKFSHLFENFVWLTDHVRRF